MHVRGIQILEVNCFNKKSIENLTKHRNGENNYKSHSLSSHKVFYFHLCTHFFFAFARRTDRRSENAFFEWKTMNDDKLTVFFLYRILLRRRCWLFIYLLSLQCIYSYMCHLMVPLILRIIQFHRSQRFVCLFSIEWATVSFTF